MVDGRIARSFGFVLSSPMLLEPQWDQAGLGTAVWTARRRQVGLGTAFWTARRRQVVLGTTFWEVWWHLIGLGRAFWIA